MNRACRIPPQIRVAMEHGRFCYDDEEPNLIVYGDEICLEDNDAEQSQDDRDCVSFGLH